MHFPIQVISDCHLEFHADKGFSLLAEVCKTSWDAEVLVICGDFATISTVETPVAVLCREYKHVLFVAGNHEYYGTTKERMGTCLRKLEENFHNFHWLNRNAVTIDGQRFVGCSMWFPYDPLNHLYEYSMNDFRQIPGFRGWVYDENKKDVEFLTDVISNDDIVITHYMPSDRSTPDRFKGSQLNRFFLCPMDGLILDRQPKIWLHGHTHDSADYTIGSTRVVCNPYGYKDHDENARFSAGLLVDVDA